ncbi:MAG: hypothetical protein U5K75_10960 [Ahrensia sp.]|nr:hypothetical protein [Ahrensia sp.]
MTRLCSALKKSKLAAAIGVSPARITQLLDRGNWTPELALKAEAVTEGALDASKLNVTIAAARVQG